VGKKASERSGEPERPSTRWELCPLWEEPKRDDLRKLLRFAARVCGGKKDGDKKKIGQLSSFSTLKEERGVLFCFGEKGGKILGGGGGKIGDRLPGQSLKAIFSDLDAGKEP